MGFQKSSAGIKLKDKHLLTAYCERPSGQTRYSEIDLDELLGVRNGQLAWGDHEFSKKSQDVSFQLEGPNNDPMLYAQVDAGDGGTQESTVNLATCIKNEDGKLCFLECF
ncbi:Cyanovirin-N [Penicillium cf. griseofulvum]|uniref:Cyanovirin-N n=1 Tax=Penicillium cf. griseofulvum TaxID=2972120 RepID=A0A9W9N1G3_9EURO|nr:Cyanovirin-N [Penicillium cf. griseofulvum]KAJ5428597.1 Cyanovirin-N [Penicillium cf. griseofulvum]